MKKKVILSSILTIALCLCLIAGSTLALFTGESKVNVAVTSGTVSVVATASDVKLGSTLGQNLSQTNATQSGNTVTLEKFVPGDYVTFNIQVENKSDVTVKYRTIIAMVEDNGLWNGLEVTVNDATYAGETKVSAWTTLAPTAHSDTVSVKVALPSGAGNDYMGKTCKFAYTVEAVQGNAETVDPDENTHYIYNVNDLMTLCNGVDSSIKRIEFVNDVNLSGYNFTTLDFDNRDVAIDGNGHTVTNLKAPLFNFYGGTVSVKNLTVDASDVIGNNGVLGTAAIVEQAQWASLRMENCHVRNTTVTAGDSRTAALVGYVVGGAEIADCSVENCNVTAQGSVAGILGHEQRQPGYWNYVKLDNCSVKNSTLASTDNGGWRVGTMIGTIAGKNTTINENCVSTGNTLTQTGKTAPDHEWYGRISNTGSLTIGTTAYVSAADLTEILSPVANGTSSFTLDKDYVVTDDWTSLTFPTSGAYEPINATFSIDGQGHTISGLTEPLVAGNIAATVIIKNLTIKDSVISSGNEGDLGRGAFIAYKDNFGGGYVYLDNCHLVNSTVTAEYAAGGLIGYFSGAILDIQNCSVSGSEISGPDDVGGLVGFCGYGTVTISNSKTTDCTIVSTKSGSYRIGYTIGTVPSVGTVTLKGVTFSGGSLTQANSTGLDSGAVSSKWIGRSFGNASIQN